MYDTLKLQHKTNLLRFIVKLYHVYKQRLKHKIKQGYTNILLFIDMYYGTSRKSRRNLHVFLMKITIQSLAQEMEEDEVLKYICLF